MNKDQIKGRAKEAMGQLKEGIGKATGKETLRAKGIAEKVAGKVQAGFGDTKHQLNEKE